MPNPCPDVLDQNLRVVPLYWSFCRSPQGQANVQTRLEIIHSHKFTSTTIILSSFLPSSIEEECFFLSRLNFIKAYIYQTFFKIEDPLSCNPWLHPLHLIWCLHYILVQVVSLISFHCLQKDEVSSTLEEKAQVIILYFFSSHLQNINIIPFTPLTSLWLLNFLSFQWWPQHLAISLPISYHVACRDRKGT